MNSSSTNNDSALVLDYHAGQGPVRPVSATVEPIRGADNLEGPEGPHEAGSIPIGGANRPRISFDLAVAGITDHSRGLMCQRFPMSRLRIEGSGSSPESTNSD